MLPVRGTTVQLAAGSRRPRGDGMLSADVRAHLRTATARSGYRAGCGWL